MHYNKIGFIGCGNMGSALARCAKNGLDGRIYYLYFSNRTFSKAESLALELGGKAVSNRDIAENCELIFIGVKPQMLEDLFAGISPALKARRCGFTLISMVAGVTVERLIELAGVDAPVIRIMPNTPVAVGAGMTQFCAKGVSDDEKSEFLELMRFAGEWDELPENLLDAASAVSGCGPAFLCLAMEGLADGAVSVGLPRQKALKYAAATLAGFGRLALESGLHPGVLKDQVTSPGGTTIQGVRALENAGVRSAFIEAVIAAYEKTCELKQNI